MRGGGTARTGCQASQTCVQERPLLWLSRPEIAPNMIQLVFWLDLSLPLGHVMPPGKEEGRLPELAHCWAVLESCVGEIGWLAALWLAEKLGVGVLNGLGEGVLALWWACSGFPSRIYMWCLTLPAAEIWKWTW